METFMYSGSFFAVEMNLLFHWVTLSALRFLLSLGLPGQDPLLRSSCVSPGSRNQQRVWQGGGSQGVSPVAPRPSAPETTMSRRSAPIAWRTGEGL